MFSTLAVSVAGATSIIARVITGITQLWKLETAVTVNL